MSFKPNDVPSVLSLFARARVRYSSALISKSLSRYWEQWEHWEQLDESTIYSVPSLVGYWEHWELHFGLILGSLAG